MTASTPVDKVSGDAQHKADRIREILDKTGPGDYRDDCVGCPSRELLPLVAGLCADTAEMVVPLYRAYFNGGLPTRPARQGRTVRVGPMDIPVGTAATVAYRAMLILGMVIVAAMVWRNRIEIGKSGLVIEPVRNSAAVSGGHQGPPI